MKKIEEQIKEGYLFGCIKYNGVYACYLMPVAYWILNYTKYDPEYNPKDWEKVFREDIYVVTDELSDLYIKSIQEYELSITELKNVNFKEKKAFFEVCVDFEKKLFINSFNYIELENYLPNTDWIGRYENPVDYLPVSLKFELKL